MNTIKNRIRSIPLLGGAFLISVSTCLAEDLCTKNEKVIISFSTKVRTNLSICKEKKNNYLAYRYGRGEKVEMQYPHILDNASWGAFTFSGIRRAGGKQNAGFGDYDLTFSVDEFDYTVFQAWNDEDGSYNIGIVVRNTKTERETRIEGLSDTQKGSLVLLDEEKSYIQNTAQQLPSGRSLRQLNRPGKRINDLTLTKDCPFDASLLIGGWVKREGEGFEEMRLLSRDDNQNFLSWIHHKPEKIGRWTFGNCIIHIQGLNDDRLQFDLEVKQLDRSMMHLRDMDTDASSTYERANSAK